MGEVWDKSVENMKVQAENWEVSSAGEVYHDDILQSPDMVLDRLAEAEDRRDAAWQKYSAQLLEVGTCPVCLATDEAGHKPGCPWGEDESERTRLQAERDELRKALGKLVADLRELVAGSRGVDGIHLNGDLAPWESLLRGGEYEDWLGSLDDAEQALSHTPDSGRLRKLEAVYNAARKGDHLSCDIRRDWPKCDYDCRNRELCSALKDLEVDDEG